MAQHRRAGSWVVKVQGISLKLSTGSKPALELDL